MYTHNSDGSYTDSVMKFFEGWLYESKELWW
jgi:hypothetical protein